MNQKQHLIALDLDGTLLTDQKTISPNTKQMIQKVMDQGHIVVIATGRSYRMSYRYYNELGLNTPIINSNGALLHHPHDKNWGLYHHPLDKKIALDIIDASYQLNSKNIIAKVHNDIYLDNYDDRIIDFYRPSLDDYPFIIGNIKNELKENPTLLMIYPNEKNLIPLTNHILDAHSNYINHRDWGAPWHIIEVMRKGMNKAAALKQVADYYHIPQERIIAFGDESNDLEMIDYAGVGVAMGNAIDELKAIANFTTDTNEQEGILNFLKNYLKTEEFIS